MVPRMVFPRIFPSFYLRSIRPVGIGNHKRRLLAKMRREKGTPGLLQMNLPVPELVEMTACSLVPVDVKVARERNLPTTLSSVLLSPC